MGGAAAYARIDEFERQLAEQRVEVQTLQRRPKRPVETTAEKHHQFVTVDEAEGVGLSTAGRLLRAVEGRGPPRVWRPTPAPFWRRG